MPGTASAELASFRLAEALAGDDRFRLFRAHWRDDRGTVLVKLPLALPLLAADAAALRREYELLDRLPAEAIEAGAARALDFVAGPAQCALLLEDRGDVPLAAAAPLPLPRIVDCAVGLAGALAALHRAGIVHRGLGPQAVLIDPRSGRVRIADFSVAVRDAGEAAAPLAPAQYRTRLPYAAPELSGRVSRAADYRSDYYALGALLYELLTGRRPFAADDPLELIHCHIARLPPAPAAIDPAVPLPLSQIVMKLLAKPAEERYQSAACLLRDLRRCRPSAAGPTVPFAIADGDVAERFAVPQRLYGRQAEFEALVAAYEQARGGPATLLLVCGAPGIGKTALIRDLHVPVANSHGHFVSGKFDLLSRDVPYGAIVQALRQLMGRRLADPAAQLEQLREALAAALGSHAAVIAEVIPEIELVLGPQPPAARLPPAEERNRFTLAFQNFIGALASRESPLVVFLDDLQWVDATTLQLVAALVSGTQVRHLLLIGAYRDSEVGDEHPLRRLAAALQADGVPVQRIALAPLAAPALTRLVADTLHASEERAAPLARLLQAKTGGNPFFAIQFLMTLHRERLIAFDPEAAQWRVWLDAVAAAALTDDVVELMSRRIERLALPAQELLTVAACLGNRFGAATLAAAAGRPLEAALAELAEAVAENLVVAESDGVFVFLHDRVQQAAYARLAAAERPQAHLRIGRRLWAQQPQAGAEVANSVFDIASHLNLGAPLIDSAAERLALARLNLVAGQRAKASAAFASARGYFVAGAALLDEADWRTAQPLAFELALEAALGETLCGEFDAAQHRLEQLLARAADDLQRASVHRLRLVQYENLGRYEQALASAREGLRLFGVRLPEAAAETEAALAAELEAIRRLLGGRAIASLIDLPVLADAAVRMTMRLLTDIWSSAYIVGDATLAPLISATLVRLSLRHGNAEESAYGYVTHAITAGPVLQDYEAAWQWGNLALQVNEKFGDLRLRAKIQQQFHAHVALWRRPFATCIAHAREACRSGLESGDFAYAAYAAATESWPAFAAAQDLEQFVRDCEPNLALLLRLKNDSFADALRLMIGLARALQGRTDAPGSLACAEFDEGRYVQAHRGNGFFSLFHAVARMQVAWTLDDYGAAERAAAAVRATAQQRVGMLWSVQFEFWNGLTAAALIDGGADRRQPVAELRRAAGMLAVLAENCTENYLCPSLLLAAELARLSGEPLAAIDRFEQAIAAAERAASTQQQALAHELAGRFWLQRGQRRIATPYLRNAMHLYAAWGAQAKVRRLVERHADLLAAPPQPAGPPAREPPPAAPALDIATIGRAAQAIAANIELEALIAQMLALAIENAGASGGVLVEDRDGVLYVAAESRDDGAIVLPHERPLEAGRLRGSGAVVRYVARTRQTVVIDEAARDERFAGDEYIDAARPRSILCLPILQQGRLQAVFYLDNTLVAAAFSAERIEVIRILAAQAAVSLRSGRLVRQMEQEIAERRRAEQQLRAIETGTAAVTGGDFFRALVRNLATALQVRQAFVAECLPAEGGGKRVRSRAVWNGDGFGDDFEYDAPGTPCEAVLAGAICHYGAGLPALFPADRALAEQGLQSYLGMPLLNAAGEVIGHMAILDTQPMPQAETALAVLRLSAGRAGAELERLKAEEDLQRALAEVGELKNRLQAENVYLRRELIANVSHDLRSPLASLRGYLDTLLLKEKSLTTAQRREYMRIAVRQAEHLQSLISQLFDLARLDFDGYQISAEPLHLGELARDVVQKFQLAAEQRQVALRLEADGAVGFVQADIGLLERALENLLENALAHTPPGGRIALALRPRGGSVEVEVSDSGCGIPAADLPHVFERFYRVDKARARNDSGSGLGLAIVKRIVELHGAEVHVDSRPDAGARFWFALPPLRVCTAQPAR